MKGNITNFFPGANTCQGFFSLFSYLPYQADHIYIIKGGPGTGKSTFMGKIGEEFQQCGYDIEKHRCASDPESLDGLRIPAFKTALLDGTAPHCVDPLYPGVVEEIINPGRFWNKKYLVEKKKEIIALSKEIKDCFHNAYDHLKKASLCKNEIETIYMNNYDPEKANTIVQTIMEKIPLTAENKNHNKRHLFASGITPAGFINYYENITAKCRYRFLINGNFNTGKSNLIKYIVRSINSCGYNLLYLHCPLQPNNIEALLISDINLAIINNSTAYTLKENDKTDIIFDIMEYVDNSALDCDEVDSFNYLFNKYMQKAIVQLKKEKEIHDKLEQYYVKAMDFIKLEKRRKEISQDIFTINSR